MMRSKPDYVVFVHFVVDVNVVIAVLIVVSVHK